MSADMPRVVHTIAGMKSRFGGTSQVVADTCSELARLGVGVDLLSQEFGAKDDRNVQPQAAAVRVCYAKAVRLPLLDTPYSTGFRRLVRATCVDARPIVVHDHGMWLPANHAVARVCRELGVPLVVSTHGMLSPAALRFDRAKKALAWRLFQRGDLQSAAAACVTSASEAQEVRAVGYAGGIAVIPPGITMPAPRREAGRHPAVRTALYLGRIHPIKGLPALVQAWARVRPAGWRMVVAGPDEGGHRHLLEDAVAGMGLGDAFRFPGPAYGAAREEWFDGASLFISPSTSESFGMTIAEALAHGLPVIATRGTPWECVRVEGCGWWVEPTVDSLAEAIGVATALPEERLREMGAKGSAMIARDFAWPTVAARLVELYRWVGRSGPRPEFMAGEGSIPRGEECSRPR